MTHKNAVHRTDDWSKTACGVEVESTPEHDTVISTGKHPREYAPGCRPCPVCYPEERR